MNKRTQKTKTPIPVGQITTKPVIENLPDFPEQWIVWARDIGDSRWTLLDDTYFTEEDATSAVMTMGWDFYLISHIPAVKAGPI